MRAVPLLLLMLAPCLTIDRPKELSASPVAPFGMISLQFSQSGQQTKEIVESWKHHQTVAQKSLAHDNCCIITSYTIFFILALSYSRLALRSDRSNAWMLTAVTALGVTLVLAAAGVDRFVENSSIRCILDQQRNEKLGDGGSLDGITATIRMSAQFKFGCLGLVGAWLVACFFAIVRRYAIEIAYRASGNLVPTNFTGLYECEQHVLNPRGSAADGEKVEAEDLGPDGEPWIRTQPHTLVGLAFSGGGIRSATFNLGVLQALDRLKLLQLFHYHSTVSGGGYIGSWWSAWRKRFFEQSNDATKMFPKAARGAAEPEEVRHLREFSNFLAPRWGFFETEMWTSFIAILFGLVPTLLVGLAVIAIAMMCWLTTTWHLGVDSLCPLAVTVTVPLGLVLILAELNWRRLAKSDAHPRDWGRYGVVTIGALLFAFGLTYSGSDKLRKSEVWNKPIGVAEVSSNPFVRRAQHLGFFVDKLLLPVSKPNDTGVGGNLKVNPSDRDEEAMISGAVASVALPSSSIHFSLAIFTVPLIWLATAIAMSLARLLLSQQSRNAAFNWQPPTDRVMLRLLIMSVLLISGGLLWEGGVYLYRESYTEVAATGAIGSSFIFALMRNWLDRLKSIQQKDSKFEALKPLMPQILAYVAVASLCVLMVALGMELLGTEPGMWLGAWIGAWLVIAFALSINPSEFGLHRLYRDRLTRAYLGASQPAAYENGVFRAGMNRYTDLRREDDIWLSDLASSVKPLHLVCCAANNLSGDQLSTLGRGARSAVLSMHGISISNSSLPSNDISLADAVTASAAAFNSQMGPLSLKLGPAVGFLMCALNLRLGIWVTNPELARRKPINGPATTYEPRWFPGLLFLGEMLGYSSCGGKPNALRDFNFTPPSHVHLSDGGHFENLAIYELIRRHCRYIVVSDCGADPDVTFEDFGNAVRRVREDFGVDIDIDLSLLRPGADGKAKQHAAVGLIRFDPNGEDLDWGVLVYFKPALTGDEPCDISNYRSLNPLFPHETTLDQFYDEAQWESYRRLGLHSAMDAFGHLEGEDDVKLSSPEFVFSRTRNRWYPTPADFETTLVDLNGRFVEMEKQLADEAPEWFIQEIYPELPTVIAGRTKKAVETVGAGENRRANEERQVVHLLVQMIQLMEDVWLKADLTHNFNHPQMLGWLNAFYRWARTPSFLSWWPVLCPLYTPGLRVFAKRHLGLDADVKDSANKDVTAFTWDEKVDEDILRRCGVKPGWEIAEVPTDLMAKAASYHAVRILARTGSDRQIDIPSGVFRFATDGSKWWWYDGDLVVIPGLWGSGIATQFFRQWLKTLPAGATCEVFVGRSEHNPRSKQRNDVGFRRERNDLLNFYKQLGFAPSEKDPNRLVRSKP